LLPADGGAGWAGRAGGDWGLAAVMGVLSLGCGAAAGAVGLAAAAGGEGLAAGFAGIAGAFFTERMALLLSAGLLGALAAGLPPLAR
jgi:hypothetical protein